MFKLFRNDKNNEQSAVNDDDTPVVVNEDTGEPVLTFDDLDVQFKTEFGRVHAVRGVSIDVQPGQVVALVGE